jgi:tetratricopeptide (TPR) repeat protein
MAAPPSAASSAAETGEEWLRLANYMRTANDILAPAVLDRVDAAHKKMMKELDAAIASGALKPVAGWAFEPAPVEEKWKELQKDDEKRLLVEDALESVARELFAGLDAAADPKKPLPAAWIGSKVDTPMGRRYLREVHGYVGSEARQRLVEFLKKLGEFSVGGAGDGVERDVDLSDAAARLLEADFSPQKPRAKKAQLQHLQFALKNTFDASAEITQLNARQDFPWVLELSNKACLRASLDAGAAGRSAPDAPWQTWLGERREDGRACALFANWPHVRRGSLSIQDAVHSPRELVKLFIKDTGPHSASTRIVAEAADVGNLRNAFSNWRDLKAVSSKEFVDALRIYGDLRNTLSHKYVASLGDYSARCEALENLCRKVDGLGEEKSLTLEQARTTLVVNEDAINRLFDQGAVLSDRLLEGLIEVTQKDGEMTRRTVLDVGDSLHEKLDVLLARLPVPASAATDVFIFPSRFMPPRTSASCFVGREVHLARLGEFVLSNDVPNGGVATTLVTGLGGQGKTTLAVEFVHRVRDRFPGGVFYVSADTPQSLLESIRHALRMDMGLAAFAEEKASPADSFAAFQRWLAQNSGWLLLVDNVDDVEVLAEAGVLPSAAVADGVGNVLITSRSPSRRFSRLVGVTYELQLDSLAQQASVEALFAHARLSTRTRVDGDNGDDPNAAEIDAARWLAGPDALAGLPLALKQAGSYVAETNGASFAAYAGLFRHAQADMLGKSTGASNGDDQLSLAEFLDKDDAFRGSRDALDELMVESIEDILEYELDDLRAQGVRPPVARRLLREARAALDKATGGPSIDDIRRQRNTVETTWQLSTSQLSPEAVQLLQTAAAYMAPEGIPEALADDRKQWDELRAYALADAVDRSVLPEVGGELAPIERLYSVHRLLCRVVRAQMNEDEDDSAFERAREAVGNGLELCIAESPDAVEIQEQRVSRARWLSHAWVLWETTQSKVLEDVSSDAFCESFAHALPQHEERTSQVWNQLLEERRRILGEEHPQTLKTWKNWAYSLQQLGRYTESEAEKRALLKVRRRVLGKEHPETLKTWNNWAQSLRSLGRYSEAEAQARTLLEVRRRVLGEEHPDTLTTWGNWAKTLGKLGQHSESETQKRALLEVRRRVLGEEHPNTLTTWSNLAGSLRSLGRYNEAEAQARTLLEVRRRVLGEEHPDTLSGRHSEVEAEHRALLEVQRRVLGERHPGTLNTWGIWALSLGKLGSHSEAEAEQRTVLELRRRVLGEEHPRTLSIWGGWALSLGKLGRHSEAEAEQRTVLEVSRRLLGEEHPFSLWNWNNWAKSIGALGRVDDAVAELQQVLDAFQRVQPGDADTKELELMLSRPRDELRQTLLGDSALETSATAPREDRP